MNKLFKKHMNIILKELKYPVIDINIQIPKKIAHGDLTTNVAMLLAKSLQKNPTDLANNIIKLLQSNYSEYYENVNVAGPGFINVKINKNIILELINKIKVENKNYGKNDQGIGKNALVEFVSANPTGPLTVAHGRGAIVGDTVSRILEWNGYKVDREYYFNNAGRQMRILGESVKARYLNNCGIETKFPDEGYQGEYINDIAISFKKIFDTKYINEKDEEVFKNFAVDKIFGNIKNTLDTLKINFDNYFNEDDLYKNNKLKETIDDLDQKGLIYKKDGATWFAGSKVNRPVDRVLIKSTGEPSYRLPDMAYHRTKFERKYDKIIDVFGADHMDAYPDVVEAMNQLDYDVDKIQVLIHQFVTITENNKPIKMSTRKANFTTLQELCDEVGPEVVRYFFIMRHINSHLNFELDVAKDQSDINPIFYLQYAHARICSIFSKSEKPLLSSDDFKFLIIEKEEQLLSRRLLIFPSKLNDSIESFSPHKLCIYLHSLASSFASFYENCPVLKSPNEDIMNSRLALCELTARTLNLGMSLLGIASPEEM